MKKTCVIALALAVGLAVAASGFARGDRTTDRGDVANVDPAANTLVVRGADGDRTFDVSMAKWAGGYTDASDIKPGDEVKVSWQMKDGTMMARKVDKMKVKGTKGRSKPGTMGTDTTGAGTTGITGGTTGTK